MPDRTPSHWYAPDLKGAPAYVLRKARRIVIFVVGMTVLLGGVVLIVLPGPAFLVIPIGLAILATEFVWARRLLKDVKRRAKNLAGFNNEKEPPSKPAQPFDGTKSPNHQITK